MLTYLLIVSVSKQIHIKQESAERAQKNSTEKQHRETAMAERTLPWLYYDRIFN
jgi:hypothetical protein